MELGVALPNLGPLADRVLMAEAAARAEDSDIADIWLGDHVAYPVTVAFPHPNYRGFAMRGDAPILDPLAVLAFVAAGDRRASASGRACSSCPTATRCSRHA